jgi:hypothetical protein
MIKRFKQFKKKTVEKTEEVSSAVPSNSMGASSSTVGTGGIDMYDPLLKSKKILKRNPPL